jgi:lantibiotic biosynthesis protein
MMTNHVGWKPLLEGEAAAEALQVAGEIAAAIAAEVARDGSGDPEQSATRQASLAGGSAGHALFFDYAAEAIPGKEEEYGNLAAESLERAIEAVAEEPMSFGLHSGFTGIAWTAEHLQRRLAGSEEPEGAAGGEDDGEDPNAEIDAALQDLVARRPWTETYDLIGGLVGLGIYALERLPRASAAACLAAIVDQLADLAEATPEGVTWFTPPELLGPWARPLNPDGHYNLGVAHGVPAVLPLLAAACREGIRAERAAPLLDAGMRWVLAQQDRTGAVSCFTNAVGPGIERTPARLAWCYGDAGIAVALLAAARLAGRQDWESEALAVARRGAERQVQAAGVRDAGLCHGAFGLAHLFNRLYQATGDDLYAQAARTWYREGLAYRQPEGGIAGFAAWDYREGEPRWAPETGFLTGAAGIGLALLAAATPHEPAWDRILMAEIPVIPAASRSGNR